VLIELLVEERIGIVRSDRKMKVGDLVMLVPDREYVYICANESPDQVTAQKTVWRGGVGVVLMFL
jgi:hypothetical protein